MWKDRTFLSRFSGKTDFNAIVPWELKLLLLYSLYKEARGGGLETHQHILSPHKAESVEGDHHQ